MPSPTRFPDGSVGQYDLTSTPWEQRSLKTASFPAYAKAESNKEK